MKWPDWLRFKRKEEVDEEMEKMIVKFRERRKKRKETSADLSEQMEAVTILMNKLSTDSAGSDDPS